MNSLCITAFLTGLIYMILSCNSRQVEDPEFGLHFSTVGLGSNFGSFEAVFTVTGNDYILSQEQTGYFKGQRLPGDTILTGKLRSTAIDSIMYNLTLLPDSDVYRLAPVMSGAIQYLHVSIGSNKYKITMDNQGDTIAQEIVSIINSHLPDSVTKLRVLEIRN